MNRNTLDDMELDGKVALTRVDLNVPVQDGKVTDATRIDRILPTIRDILAKGGKPVLLAHFGRPGGRRAPGMSLRTVIPALEKALGRPIVFAHDCVGDPARAAVAAMERGEILLLENVRFHPGEEKNEAAFAASLAELGDIYCNDAFSAAHRAHASTEGIAHLLPSCAGRAMQAEIEALETALGSPARPLTAVVGGSKVSTKLELLGNLARKADSLAVGGGMANTFLAAQGMDVGKSLAERDMADAARDIMDLASGASCEILLPADVVIAREFAAGAPNETVPATSCPPDAMILDAGPDSVARIVDVFRKSSTLIWNGPLGAFELEPFDRATCAAAAEAAKLTRDGALISVAGGGDTVAALNRAGVAGDFTYISTAGGAFLEWMEGKTLPGVAALET